MERETFTELMTRDGRTAASVAALLHVRAEVVRRWIEKGTAPTWAIDDLRRGGSPSFIKHRRDGLPMLDSESVNTDLGAKLLEIARKDARSMAFVHAVLAPVGFFADDQEAVAK